MKEIGRCLKRQLMTQKAGCQTEVNVGRNDPCPCGSGKKYKKIILTASKTKIFWTMKTNSCYNIFKRIIWSK